MRTNKTISSYISSHKPYLTIHTCQQDVSLHIPTIKSLGKVFSELGNANVPINILLRKVSLSFSLFTVLVFIVHCYQRILDQWFPTGLNSSMYEVKYAHCAIPDSIGLDTIVCFALFEFNFL